MIKPGDRVIFRRGAELCEGFCTVLSVDYATKDVRLTPIPDGIREGDEMMLCDPLNEIAPTASDGG